MLERRNDGGEEASSRWLRGPLRKRPLLPLVLLGSMVVIGLVLEAAVYGAFRWPSKLPLIGLFLVLALRRWRAARGGR